MLRRQLKAHVRDVHFGVGVEVAVDLVIDLWNKGSLRDASRLSELRYSAVPSHIESGSSYLTTYVFNWRMDGWSPGYFRSESYDFGGGILGGCNVHTVGGLLHSHFIGLGFSGIGLALTHTRFELLDKWDKCTRLIYENGSLTNPTERDHTKLAWGVHFTPTQQDKDESVRLDGSVRVRAVIRLFREKSPEPSGLRPSQQAVLEDTPSTAVVE
jgi:hypothetical protein